MPRRLWDVPALATPYKERLTVEERIAGLSLFWSEARAYFVHFDHVPDLAWDAVYMEYLPKVMAAETTRDYYAVLMQLAPLLQDGHTNIYPPKELTDAFYARPPVRTELVEGRVLVTEVRSAKLAEQVQLGDEIVAIDGVPVQEYATEKVQPYVSSSTPQDRRLRTFTYQLRSGDAKKPLLLTLRTGGKDDRTVSIMRGGYTDVANASRFQFRMLPDGIAYLSVDHFESDAGVKAFEAALPQIMSSRGLILDLRRNGGGSTNYGLEILSYLTERPIPTALSMFRGESGLDRSRGDKAVVWTPVSGTTVPYQKARAQHFAGPVTVLAGPQTFSAAEDFLVSFSVLKRGPIVGEATGGSTGQPLQFALPGGGRARICVKRDPFPDGSQFVGQGIQPTVIARPTIEDVRARRDPGLEAGIAALK